jgi:broad specificity phosphatase PhoE
MIAQAARHDTGVRRRHRRSACYGASVRLYLVRHGLAAASFDEAMDPGLDSVGRDQAEAVAARLAPLGPLPIVVSPLRRTRETASAFERQWRLVARIEPPVSEIPSPGLSLAERRDWLRGVMTSRWPDLGPELLAWRRGVLTTLTGILDDSVVVTHFIAINVAVGEATSDDRVRCFAPDYCSVTTIEVERGAIRLVERGAEAATEVL